VNVQTLSNAGFWELLQDQAAAKPSKYALLPEQTLYRETINSSKRKFYSGKNWFQRVIDQPRHITMTEYLRG
tara:strand:+ start:1081 stop:1296 length:216 start_codon:yes stop_codon:yes gene_type:complete